MSAGLITIQLLKNININIYKMKFTLFTCLLSSLFFLQTIGQPQLTFRFSNPVISESTPPVFQFDVDIKASQPGTFLRDLQVYLNYNTSAFGSNVVANGKITVTKLALLSNHYQIVNQADNSGSGYAIITEGINEMNQSGSGTYFNEAPLDFTGILRFQIEITDISQTAGVFFDEALMNGGQYHQSTVNTNPIAYQNTNLYDNTLNNLSLSGHTITLEAGWSGISSYLEPFDASIGAIYSQIESELVILQNFSGVYWPDGNVNTLGTWNVNSGYIIKVTDNCHLKILGSEMENPSLELVPGWNLMPVKQDCETDANSLFSNILPRLIIVKEVAGPGMYWPLYGINTLGQLIPGKAYFVKMSAADTLQFPACN